MSQEHLKNNSSSISFSSKLIEPTSEHNISNFSPTLKNNRIYTLSNTFSQLSTFSNYFSNKIVKIQYSLNEYYKGETNEKLIPNGFGYYFYPNNEYYFGNFINGKREGIGTYQYKDGICYKGQWKNNKKNGEGIIKNFNNKWEFNGIFENDIPIEGKFNKLNDITIITDFNDIEYSIGNENNYFNDINNNSIISFSNQSNNSISFNDYLND